MNIKRFVKNKRLLIILLIPILCIVFHIQTLAHSAVLNVTYDNCSPEEGDGYSEMWYLLYKGDVCYHISHEENIIKYCYESSDAEWIEYVKQAYENSITDETALDVVRQIKIDYANSMKKWNNVYFYSYDSEGTVTKNRLINVVEAEDANSATLLIYPNINDNVTDITIANTSPDIDTRTVIESGEKNHYHYSKWIMNLFLDQFVFRNGGGSISYARDVVGAHELGHVLGLKDVDSNNLCNGYTAEQYDPEKPWEYWHHHELLMGYGSPTYERSEDITYKDIAGVAITRGFHTDEDHKWLYVGQPSSEIHKFICSICNGVREVNYLQGYTYDIYGSCENNHSLSSGNMMAVASYGSEDYYKCKYCRYVAPFDYIVEQSYIYELYTDGLHKCTNTVNGLEYTFYEEHIFENHACTKCNYHSHSYTQNYVSYNKLKHWCYCYCGDRILQPHVLSMPNGQVSDFCMICGELIFGTGTLDSIPSDYPHTENGSYILPNGIIVLVPEDEEAYFNGTLEFRTGEVM